MSKEEHKCSAEVYNYGGMGGFYPCSRKGKHFEEGKWWCKQHSPNSVAKRKKQSDIKYEAERAKGRERDRIMVIKNRLYDAYLKGLIDKSIIIGEPND